MNAVKTHRIWSISSEGLVARNGTIELSEMAPVDRRDINRIVTVESGLHASDAVVFLGFTALQDEETEHIESYLVTRVNKDGSGVMVTDDFARTRPREHITPRFIELSRFLHGDEQSFAEFGAEWIDDFVRAQTNTQ